jgi:hypothetical protein
MKYGLSYTEIHHLVSDYGKKLDCCPQKWQGVGFAGFEWVMCFIKLHPHLSFKKPESTHLARATGLNDHNVTDFTITTGNCLYS